MPVEVVILGGKSVVILDIEHLAKRTCAIPKADFAVCLDSTQLIEEMRSHRRHPRTTTNKHHLCVGFLSEELTERTVNINLITRLQIKHPTRHDAGRQPFGARRGRRHTNIELNHTLFFRIIRHRIGSNRCIWARRLQLKKTKMLPIASVLLTNIEI